MAGSRNQTDVDFVRFVMCDLNGVARCKVVPRCSYEQLSEPGNIGLPNIALKLLLVEKETFPDMDSWHLCPWSGTKSSRKVAQIICEMKEKDKDFTPCGFDARYVCRKLLNELKSGFGLDLFSALEYEFAVGKNGKPATSGYNIYSPVIMKTTEDFCFDMCDRLGKAGISLETMMTEHGDGQLELTMKPAWGVKAADRAFIYKQCAKETAIDHGMMATFMCNPWLKVQCGGHYNFSLWKDGVSVFTDNSDPDGLSNIAKHWIAGIMEHAQAITALVCPTNNCYNRFFEGGFAPYHICYAVENRISFIRVKRSESSGTHLEFRSAGSAANPYLVMVAMVAAGLDGLRRKLNPPPAGFSNEKSIPRTLKAALDALEDDKILRAIIGDELITPFLLSKRAHDIPLESLEEQFAIYSPVI